MKRKFLYSLKYSSYLFTIFIFYSIFALLVIQKQEFNVLLANIDEIALNVLLFFVLTVVINLPTNSSFSFTTSRASNLPILNTLLVIAFTIIFKLDILAYLTLAIADIAAALYIYNHYEKRTYTIMYITRFFIFLTSAAIIQAIIYKY